MKTFRITSLEAHQIGPFGDLKMVFPEKPKGMEGKAEVHILTGENGVGKSTILEILAEAFGGIQVRVEKCRVNHLVNCSFKVGSTIGTIKSHKLGDKTNVRTIPGGFPVREETEVISNAAFAYSSYRRIDHIQISSLQEIPTKPLENALNFRNSIDPTLILQWIANIIAKEAIAERNSDPNGTKRYRTALKNVESAISKIIEKQVKFDLEYEPFTVIITVDQERLNFNQLPDGLKSIISWLADLLMRMDRVRWVDDIPVFERNFILFLDEIEVHMHPRWQRKILPAVQGLFPNAQIFISTHSPFVINSVDGAWIHRLVKPNGDSVAL